MAKGGPREQYRRIYWLLHPAVSDAEAERVFRLATPRQHTVGWSFDDAGIGDLDSREVALWGCPDGERQMYLDWYAQYYPGVTVTFKNIPPEIIDVVDSLPRHATKEYDTRALAGIDTVVVHHSAGSGDARPEDIASYHVNTRDWPGISYHYLVNAAGTVYQVNRHETISFHAAGQNSHSLGVCLLGNFHADRPPESQLAATRSLLAWLQQELPGVTAVAPHRLMPGSITECPGDTWVDWWAEID